jgi:hypothetical protein
VLSTGVSVAPRARLIGAIQVAVRPAARRNVRTAVPVPTMEPAVNARGLAFR